MAAKLFSVPSTGTVYCIIKRMSDGYYLNDSGGAFASAPADPHVSLTEDTVAKGLFALSESRTVWTDGTYRIIYYKQVGGSPAPVTDAPPVKIEDVAVCGDRVVTDEEANFMAIYLRQGIMGLVSARREDLSALSALAKSQKINNAFTGSIGRAQKRI